MLFRTIFSLLTSGYQIWMNVKFITKVDDKIWIFLFSEFTYKQPLIASGMKTVIEYNFIDWKTSKDIFIKKDITAGMILNNWRILV